MSLSLVSLTALQTPFVFTESTTFSTPLLGLFGIEPKYLSECIISPKQVADVGIETTVQAGTVN